MEYSQYVVCALLLLCPLVNSKHDDDLIFNNNEEFQGVIASMKRSSRTISRTLTDTFSMPFNRPPILKRRVKKLLITAGKMFRYIIPSDLFMDPEQGNNLNFTMYDADNIVLSPESWIQFDPTERKVYGLPLKSHVSRWSFIIEAQDSEGLATRGPLDITVQQHKSMRTINHQFIMRVKLLKDFKNVIDWQIRALEGIIKLFSDTDIDQLTTLNTSKNGDLYEFMWANDTLPKYPVCPLDEINRLMKIMESNTERGRPSADLTLAMSPDLMISEIWWNATGQCSFESVTITHTPVTFPPITRNQIDHLVATVGYLFIYKVPEDTFFDLEDGDTRNLQLSIRFSNGSEIPSNHWLQFDVRNQEFYGLPISSNEKSVQYLLIAEDSTKNRAYDSLVVDVAKAPTICPNVQFQMTIDPLITLINSASNTRKVVEKLAALSGQNNTHNIRIENITDNPTTITWYNTNLVSKIIIEIEELSKMIIVDQRETEGDNLNVDTDQNFNKGFKITSIRLIPLGLCVDQNMVPIKPGNNTNS